MEGKLIDLSTVIGVYPVCNTGAVLLHQLDYGEDKVLASLNGTDPEWCSLTEEYCEYTEELEPGFRIGSFLCRCVKCRGFMEVRIEERGTESPAGIGAQACGI